MPSTLAHILNKDILRQLAGFQAFRDGHQYFERGQVYGLKEEQGTISAKVLGLYEYTASLWVEGTAIGHSCSCPVGQEFCKHSVALGLSWLDETDADKDAKTEVVSIDPIDVVKTYLALQDRAALIDIIMEQVMNDDRLRERLLFRSARSGPHGIDTRTFRLLIDSAANPGGTEDYADRLDEIVSALSELLNDGYASEALELTEYTLNAIATTLGSSDRDFEIQDTLYHLQDLHLSACRTAKPDPKKLAQTLFEWRLNPVWDLFYDVMATYAEVLDSSGLLEYRSLAEAEWAQAPNLSPGDEPPERYGRRFRLAYIMETLAKQTGEIEALVWVKQKDLSQPSSFLGIAELYKQAGHNDQALEWAERGMKAFPNRKDPGLKDFLIREYELHGRYDEAEELKK